VIGRNIDKNAKVEEEIEKDVVRNEEEHVENEEEDK